MNYIKKRFNSLFLLIGLLSTVFSSQASHVSAADLTFAIIGPHKYKVTLTVYRDCNGNVLNTSQTIKYKSVQCNVLDSAVLVLSSGFPAEEQILCAGQTSACNGGTNTVGMMKYVFTGIINLPSGCGTDWTIYWSQCNRNAAITNLQNAGGTCMYIEAKLNNTVSGYDSSPYFLNSAMSFCCVNQLKTYNHGGVDPNGDSLHYYLMQPRQNANSYINYANGSGLSVTTPLAVNSTIGFNIDPINGTLTFMPTQQQIGVVTIGVDEYRNGVLIGHVERDLQIIVKNCTDTISPTTHAVGTSSLFGDSILTCSQTCFSIVTAHPDTAQTLTLNWDSSIVGATFSVTSGKRPTGTFCWTPTNNDAGVHSFTVKVIDQACPIPNVNIYGYTLFVKPTTPAGPDKVTCQYSTATTAASGTGTWSALAGNPATTSFSNSTSPTTTISGFTNVGVYLYQWQTNTGCPDTMQVTVNAKPNAGGDDSICLPNIVTANATGTGVWSSMAGNAGTSTIASSTNPTTTFSNFSAGGLYHYIWTNNGCSDTMYVYGTPANPGGANQTICQFFATNMAAITAGNWSVISGNPTVTTFANPALPTTSVNGFTLPGVYNFLWTTSTGCLDTVSITVTAKPNAGADQTICQFTNTSLNAVGAGVWSAFNTNPVSTTFTNSTLNNTGVSGFTLPGNYEFIWTVNGCTDTVVIHVTAKPSAGIDQTICQFFNTNLNAVGNGKWTALTTNPVATTFVNDTLNSTGVNGFSIAGNYYFVWTVNSCTDTVKISVTAKPDAGIDQIVCQYFATNLAGVGIGNWSAMNTNPTTLTFTNPSLNSTSVSGFNLPSIYNQIWTVNACTDTMQISVTAKPNAGSDQIICQFFNTNLNSVGTGKWTSLSTNPMATVFADDTLNNTLVTGFNLPGNYQFIWTSNNCTDTVKVSVTAKPDAGADQTVCQLSTATLHGIGTGFWTAMNTNSTTTIFSDSTLANTLVNGISSTNNYQYIWNVNGCTDTTQFTITPKPFAGADQIICQFTTTNLGSVGIGSWTSMSSNPAVTSMSNANSNNPLVSGFSLVGIYKFIWTSNACTDTVSINVVTTPNAGKDSTVCQFATYQTNPTGIGVWSALPSNPSATFFSDSTLPITTISGFSVVSIYGFEWRTNNCSDTFYLQVKPKPDAGLDKNLCLPGQITTAAIGSGSWMALTSNPNGTNFSNPLINNTAVTNFTTGGDFKFEWNVNGCTDTMDVFVTPQNSAGNDIITCQFSAATTNAFGKGIWSPLASNPGAVIFDKIDTNIAHISGFNLAGNYQFIWTSNGCTDTILISVTPKPNAGLDQILCLPGTIHSAALGNGSWLALNSNPGASNMANSNQNNTLISGFLNGGFYQYEWTVNACTDTFGVQVIPLNSAGIDQTICQFTSTSMNAFGVGKFTALSTNPSSIIFANDTLNNTLVSGFNQAGIYGIIWIANGCPDTVLINVTAKPAAGIDQTICQFSSTNLAGIGVGNWSLLSTNQALISFANATLNNTQVTGFATAGVYRFVWTVNGCTDTVSITVTPKPDAGIDQTICQYTNTNLAGIGVGNWSLLSTNPAVVSFANATLNNTQVTGFTIAGIYNFVWTVNGCTDTVSVNVTAKPDAGVDQTICQFTTTNLAGIGVGNWSLLSTNPVVVSFANATLNNTQVTGFTTAGVYGFVWAVNGCTDTVSITVTPKPDAGIDQTICQYTTTNLAGIGVGNWSLLSTNPAVVSFANANLNNTQVTGFTIAGIYDFVWTVNGCTDTVSITVTAKPDAGIDQTICQFTTTNLAGIGAGNWSLLSTNSAVVSFANATLNNTQVTGFTIAGVYGFVWTVNGCTDTVSVNVTAKPDAGIDQIICQFTTTNLAGIGTGNWSALSTNPAVVSFANPTLNNTPVTGFTIAGVYGFVWTVNGCTDTVSVIVTPKPNAGIDQTICQFFATNFAAVGNGNWTALNTNPAIVTIINPNLNNSLVGDFLIAGNYNFVWTVNGCSDTVLIKVNPKPNAGVNQQIATFSSTTLNATPTPGNWTEVVGNPLPLTILNEFDPHTSVSGFNLAGDYLIEWAVAGCTDTVDIHVLDQPNAGADTFVCINSSLFLNGSGVGVWSALAGNPSPVTIQLPTDNKPFVSGFSVAGNYYFIKSFPGLNTDTLKVVVFPLPTLSLQISPAKCTLPTGSAKVIATLGNAPYTYVWNDGSTLDSVVNKLYNDTVKVMVTDSTGCKSSIFKKVGSYLAPLQIQTDSIHQISCFGIKDGAIITKMDANFFYSWNTGSTKNQLDSLAKGTYVLTVKDVTGCFATDSFKIVEPAKGILVLSPKDTLVKEDSIFTIYPTLLPYGNDSIRNYYWNPANNLSCDNCELPVFSGSAGIYPYILNVTYNEGCKVADSMRVVVVSEHKLYIPNAFSPNGDANNDVYFVYAKGVKYFEMEVFNRWGEKVFYTNDIGKGWDGIYKGATLEPSVYVYVVTVVYNDNFTLTDKGTITLVR